MHILLQRKCSENFLGMNDIINHIRNRTYMGGVERERARVKATGEVFTPTALVQEILDQLPEEVFADATKTFLDPTCGDGQFLGEVLIRKMENGSTYAQALNTTYGVDLMPDNVRECIRRLYMVDDNSIEEHDGDSAKKRDPNYEWSSGLQFIYWITSEHYTGWAKIVCADGLKYDYSFGKNEQESFGNGLFYFA